MSILIQSTPIQKLEAIQQNNQLFMKRDDLLNFSFGGNKARKAKKFFEEIEQFGSDVIVTYGSSSSNHCRIIANLAAAKHKRCIIISPVESNKVTNNQRLMKLFKAEIITCLTSDVGATIEKTMAELKSAGFNPYFIPGGGHGNLGTAAYVEVYDEIKAYEIENNIFFDYIFHVSGTGTTQAGLVCGRLLNHDKRKIIGISNARKNPYGEKVVLDSVNSYLKQVSSNCVDESAIDFEDSYVMDGYGNYNDEILEVIKRVMIMEGIPLDTVYTGKGFWGMEEYIRKHHIKGKNILFIHTGGTPLFFDDLEVLLNE